MNSVSYKTDAAHSDALAILRGDKIDSSQSLEIDSSLEVPKYASVPIDVLLESAQNARMVAKNCFQEAEAMEVEIMRRMQHARATQVFHPDYEEIALKPRVRVETRVDVLQELLALADAGELPKDLVGKALCVVVERKWKTHKTYLNQIKKYGGKAADIVARGVIEQQDGFFLSVKRRS